MNPSIDTESKIHPTAIVSASCVVGRSCLEEYSRLKNNVEFRESQLGAYSYVSSNSVVNKTKIGRFCSIAHGSYIGLWEHNTYVTTHSFYLYETSGGFVKGYRNYDRDKEETFIENDVWIGANAVILKGVRISSGAIVGASSVVIKDVPPFAVVFGNPARVLKFRFSSEDIAFFLKAKWWDLSRDVLQDMVNEKVWYSLDKFKQYCLDKKIVEENYSHAPRI